MAFIPDYSNKEEKQNYYSNLRVVVSGSVFEFYQFDHPVVYGPMFKKKKSEEEKENEPQNPMTEEEKLLASARRAKRKIKRTIRANAFNWFNEKQKPYLPITLTLTFAEDIKDIETANNLFTDFIQRLNYSVNLMERNCDKKEAKKNRLKYSAVIEFQDKNRGGVIHYHMIFYNLPKMAKIYDRLAKIWGQGYFWVGTKSKNGKKGVKALNTEKKVQKVVEYFTKYITKSFNDERLKNKKKYFNSRELIKPAEIEVEELVDLIKKTMPEGSLVYEAGRLAYKYKHFERYFDYQKFDLSDFPEEKKEALNLVNMY
jgi:hypothetical protein